MHRAAKFVSSLLVTRQLVAVAGGQPLVVTCDGPGGGKGEVMQGMEEMMMMTTMMMTVRPSPGMVSVI